MVCPGLVDTPASRPWFGELSQARTPVRAAEAILDLVLADRLDPATYGELVRFGQVLAWHSGTPPEYQNQLLAKYLVAARPGAAVDQHWLTDYNFAGPSWGTMPSWSATWPMMSWTAMVSASGMTALSGRPAVTHSVTSRSSWV